MFKNKRLRLVRLMMMVIWSLFEKLLTRTTITGLEDVPRNSQTPLIFAANHASTYDPPLLMRHIPVPIRPVGPGDFKMLFPGNLIVERLGVIRINRGAADRESLKIMMDVLKNGDNLSLFPEGGTWEKRLDDVKPGVAYLSLMTGAQIVPVSIGGTYQVWRKIFQFRRPRITMHFSPPLPPVVSTDRKQRQEDLRQASLKLMHIIYDNLPPSEQARYDLYARQQFSAKLDVVPHVLELDSVPDFSVLAEIISKPNLFSPLYRNLKLPLEPFLSHQHFHAADSVLKASQALLDAFANTVPGYVNYRLGDDKAAQLTRELETLVDICQRAKEHDLVIRLSPIVMVLDEPLPPNS